MKKILLILLIFYTMIGIEAGTAGVLVVTNTNDSGAGSLRQAIADAASSDTITFDAGLTDKTIYLEGYVGLQIDKNLIIRGLGARHLSISGSGGCRVFYIAKGCHVEISDVTIRDGYTGVDESKGGGIWNEGYLSLSDVIITNNGAAGQIGFQRDGFGGGIYTSDTAVLSLNRCAVINNTARGSDGQEFPGHFVVGDGAAWGGGIYGSNITCINTTISGNNALGGTFYLESYNTSGGGGVCCWNSSFTHCTIACNQTDDWIGYGGGIYSSSETTLSRCIISNNVADTGLDICGYFRSEDYNLIYDSLIWGMSGETSHNIIHQDPLLLPLKDNGGQTPTHGLTWGSPAIDAIPPSALIISEDQRGEPRPYNTNGDIGAYEFNALSTVSDWTLYLSH